ncbi:MAG: bifunctional glutamate N-acetyltransferase/amino-acid acetyltransferase ArgJ [Planctomycetota bacterium]|nr:MAG: bifunctional glutamate N-acetyltransferase/amino-acid acetyltransferase ArgJ [Planctomycetota bacterium]
MAIRVPKGFLVSGVHCGLKRDLRKPDLTLIVSETPAVAAGVYTQNRVFAAPVQLDRERTPNDKTRVVVIDSGNANACTGERGLKDAYEMARLAAEAVGATEDQALVLSTGIIGTYLPMDKIAKGIELAAKRLGNDEEALILAARGMMTTDTVYKLAGRTISIARREIQLTGMVKGAAMMGPNLATMLGVVITDATLTPETAQRILREVVEDTFNCINVDGHMSTNDTVLLLANGAAGGPPLEGDLLDEFKTALHDLCSELARMIPADGEGATHLITIEVEGCKTREDALQIARTIANSPLVKAAIHGADPNWGRIVSAAGYAGVPFDPKGISLRVNGYLLYQGGVPVEYDEAEVSASIRAEKDTLIELELSEGDAKARFWTTDLTPEYVRLNADYHT